MSCSDCLSFTLLIVIPQIVEEFEDRLGRQMDEILSTVRSSLTESKPATANQSQDMQVDPEQETPGAELYVEDAEGWEYDANVIVFDDTGEGAGVEGDLDVDDDD